MRACSRRGLRPDVHAGRRRDLSERRATSATRVEVPGSVAASCAASSGPGHFEGVATVVAKLFHIVQPDVAVFGEKDFQQLTIIRRMVADLCMPVRDRRCADGARADGLAMSSRNQYLTAAGAQPRAGDPRRAAARRRQRLQAGDDAISRASSARASRRSSGGISAGLFRRARRGGSRHAPRPTRASFVVLTAARLGKARLIDNVQVRALSRPGRRLPSAVCSAHSTCSRTSADASSRRASQRCEDFRAESGHCPAPPRCCADQRS